MKDYCILDSDLLGMLLVVFVTLKLFKLIEWSWFWVLCPLWISIEVSIILLLIFKIMKKI